MNTRNLTIVLPTRNEKNNIPLFLTSLPKDANLIAVDASEDQTPDLIEALRPERTLVLRYPSTITEARQVGSEVASTDWLLFSDADVVFPPDYFSQLCEYAGYDVVYGPKLSHDGAYERYYRGFALGQRISHALGIPAATGSNLLIRKEAWAQVGGFDPGLSCNEDSELVWRIKRAGFRVAFAPYLAVYATDHRRLELGLWRKTWHSVARCLFLYWGLMPHAWRCKDWGYWDHLRQES